jgi:hypothetical protein
MYYMKLLQNNNTYKYRLSKILDKLVSTKSDIRDVMIKHYRFLFLGDPDSYMSRVFMECKYPCIQIVPNSDETTSYFEITLIEPKWSGFIGTILIRVIETVTLQIVNEYKQTCFYFHRDIVFDTNKTYKIFVQNIGYRS